MTAIISAFFTAVNAVIKLFGGEQIDVSTQVADVLDWFRALGFTID